MSDFINSGDASINIKIPDDWVVYKADGTCIVGINSNGIVEIKNTPLGNFNSLLFNGKMISKEDIEGLQIKKF